MGIPKWRYRRTDRETIATRTARTSGYANRLLFSALVTVLVALCGCAGTTVTASQGTPAPVTLHLNAGSYSLAGFEHDDQRHGLPWSEGKG